MGRPIHCERCDSLTAYPDLFVIAEKMNWARTDMDLFSFCPRLWLWPSEVFPALTSHQCWTAAWNWELRYSLCPSCFYLGVFITATGNASKSTSTTTMFILPSFFKQLRIPSPYMPFLSYHFAPVLLVSISLHWSIPDPWSAPASIQLSALRMWAKPYTWDRKKIFTFNVEGL